MANLTCPQCGSEYEVSDYHIPVREPDSIECEVCGLTLKKWRGSRQYTAKLIKRGKWSKAAKKSELS